MGSKEIVTLDELQDAQRRLPNPTNTPSGIYRIALLEVGDQ